MSKQGNTYIIDSALVREWQEQGYDYNREFGVKDAKEEKSFISPDDISLNPYDLGSKEKASPIVQFLSILGILLAIGVGAYLYFRRYGIVQKKVNFADLEEDTIYDIDFDKELAQYEMSCDYFQCVRLCYLSLLRHLHDTNRINWMPHKTSTQYIYEMKSEANFIALTNLFTKIRYGNYEATKELYDEAKRLAAEVRHEKGGAM
ncbi:MAG: DUF4129 domain-containing protein [Prevotellaceae bacterium]|nr:DUF4129 domain-containing protein [Candidatus Minthosoma caballi]